MDGPKNNNGIRYGAILHKKTFKKCLPKKASIFSAEICAMNLALKLVSTSNKFLIHLNSITVLQSLKNTKLDNPFIVKLLNQLNSMNHCKKVIFCWIPIHIGIQENNKADSLAKAALNIVPDKKSKLPYSDFKLKIRQIITKKWQQLLEKNPPPNKLFQAQPILKEKKLDPINTRREETILARPRIGHTRLTLSFILKDEPPPKCPCGNQYTIKHILIKYTKLTNIR